MKKNSGKQVVLNYVSQHLSHTFRGIRRGIGLDSSMVNSSLWQMNKDGQVRRGDEYRGHRYTLIDTTAVTESDPSTQYRQHPGSVDPMTNLFSQCLAGIRK